MCKLRLWSLSGCLMETNYISCRCSVHRAELDWWGTPHIDWATFRSKYSLVESIKEDFTNVPIMALTATAPPEILLKLRRILKEPYLVQSSINREKISLHVEQRPDKRPTSPTCRGHYTGFAMLYSIYRFCGWCRTNPSLKWEYWSVGYYGERDTTSKHEAHASWRERRASHCCYKGFWDGNK